MACVPSIVSMAPALIPASRPVEQRHFLGIVSMVAAQILAFGFVKRHRLLDACQAELGFVRTPNVLRYIIDPALSAC
jgi:hypothetical protein